MTRVPDRNGSATFPLLKVVYLLAVTAIAFMVPAFATTRPARWFVVPALLAFQIVILLACRFPITEIARPVWRLKWLFLFLIGCYVLLPAENPGAVLDGQSADGPERLDQAVDRVVPFSQQI